jgi:ATP-dependent DNA helicase HFM1/MER3
LAIITLLSHADRARSKVVYMAPTKVKILVRPQSPFFKNLLQALCSERYRDWCGKFNPLGIQGE